MRFNKLNFYSKIAEWLSTFCRIEAIEPDAKEKAIAPIIIEQMQKIRSIEDFGPKSPYLYQV